jgi:hypothetical protein
VEALHRLLNVLLEQRKYDSSEVYQLALRMIHVHHCVIPQTASSRLALANCLDFFAAILNLRLRHEDSFGKLTKKTDFAIVGDVDKEAADVASKVVPIVEENCDEKGLVTSRKGEDEWNRGTMKKRAFHCVLRAVTICAIDETPTDRFSSMLSQLNSVAEGVVEDLINSGQLDLSGKVAEWKGTSWEAVIEECKHTMVYADPPDIIRGNDETTLTVTREENFDANLSERKFKDGQGSVVAIPSFPPYQRKWQR